MRSQFLLPTMEVIKIAFLFFSAKSLVIAMREKIGLFGSAIKTTIMALGARKDKTNTTGSHKIWIYEDLFCMNALMWKLSVDYWYR